jgi:hypothetical protein
MDDAIYDEGHGLTLSFFLLTGGGMELSDALVVRGFEADTTGRVVIPDGSGQTFSMRPDMQGGTRVVGKTNALGSLGGLADSGWQIRSVQIGAIDDTVRGNTAGDTALRDELGRRSHKGVFKRGRTL